MNKTNLRLLVGAVGLALTGGAYADGNVVLFGIVDAGIMSQSKVPTANGNKSAVGFQDAQILPSIYGIKGNEDLGGGLSAGFELEGGFNAGNGSHNSPGVYQTQIFGRVAQVSLGGSWGKAALGLQVDPALIAAIGTEPRGMADSLSLLEPWIIATVANNNAGKSGSLTGGIFDQNSISYTYVGSGLYLGYNHSFGGYPGQQSAGSGDSLGVSYNIAGFTASAGFAQDKAAVLTGTAVTGAATSSKISSFGLGYAIGIFAVRGQIDNFKSSFVNGVAASNVQAGGIGFDVKPITGNTINLSVYSAKDKGATFGGKTTEVALMDTESLSKRTDVYVQLASVKTDAKSGVDATLGGIYTVGGAVPLGVTTTFFGLGVQHKF